MAEDEVAIAIREDTGVIKSRDGATLSDLAHVRCDSCKTVRPIPNAYLVDEAYGAGHAFDGAEFDPDCIADDRHRVIVYFFRNQKGKRVAKFHYVPKYKFEPKTTDPYYLTVVEGKKFLVTVGKIKGAS